MTGFTHKAAAWLTALLTALGLMLGAGQAARADADIESGWADDGHARARLVFGEWRAGGTALIGVEIVLQPGWHTFWRTPGDAGLPPRFEWAGSEGAKPGPAHFPWPEPFDVNGYRSHGYADRVIFPVIVEAEGQATLRLTLAYAVCADICMLNEADLALTLDPDLTRSPHRPAIVEALAQSPQKTGLAAKSWFEDKELVIELAQPRRIEALLVEGPDGMVLDGGASERGVWRFQVGMADRRASLPGRVIKLTAKEDRGSVAFTARVEKPAQPGPSRPEPSDSR